MFKKNYITLIVAVVFFVVISLSSEAGTKIQSLPDGVSVYTLDNGMEVLLIENSALPMIGVNVVVKIGSAYETFATSGMSHMLEHLLFNGTSTMSQKELYDAVDLIGGYNNANTSEYYTNFMMVAPAEHIRQGMEIQAGMLFDSILPEEKFKKEKGIVLEELSKSLASPPEQMERNVNSILYKGHALSLPTLGTYSTIKSMIRDDVYDFYKNNYVPNNMIISVIGSFDSAEMKKLINSIYGKAKPGIIDREVLSQWSRGFMKVPDKPAEGSVYHRNYDGDSFLVKLFYSFPFALSPEVSEMLDVAIEDWEEELQNDLDENFPESFKSLTLSVRATPVDNYLEVSLVPEAERELNKPVNFISSKLHGMDFTLSKEKISAAIPNAQTAFLKNIEKPHMFGIFNAENFAVNGIESVLSLYEGSSLLKGAELLESLTFSTEPIIVIHSPAETKTEDTLTSVGIAGLFEDNDNGSTLIAVQNQNSKLTAIHYFFKHKAYYESKYGKDGAQILHDCFAERLKSEENEKKSSSFGLSFVVNDNPYFPMDNIYLHPDFGYIRIEALASQMEELIDFLSSEMTGFVPTKEEFEKARQKIRQQKMMQMGGNKAKELFNNSCDELLYESCSYDKNEESVSYEGLVAMSREYFRPANIIVSVVSPETPEKIRACFSDFKGGIQSESLDICSDRLVLQDKPTVVEKEGDGKRAYLFWGFVKTIASEDQAALKALSLVLSDNIVMDIREKQGMAYGMSAGIEVVEDKALFYIRQGTMVENVDKLLPQYPGFFDKKIISELTEKDLEKFKNMYLGKMAFRRLSSINQAYYLANSFYFHNDIDYDKKALEKLKAVTVEDIKKVAEKYLKIKNPITVIVR